jgi:glycosyltransferase involved in cell wall biosynthesis
MGEGHCNGNMDMLQNKHMNICFFTPIFLPSYSGATLQAITLAKELRKKRFKILFVALTSGNEKKSVFDDFDIYYIHVEDLNRIIEGTASAIEYLKLVMRLYILLFRLRTRFSIIHSHVLGHPYTALSIIGCLLKKKTVAKVTMSNDIDFNRIGHLQGKLNKCMTKRFDRLIAISTDINQDLRNININHKKIECIPNSINTERFHPVSTDKKKEIKKKFGINAKYVISYVGGITFRKGIDFLVEIWPDIIKICPDSVLVLVGPKGVEDGVLGDMSCYEEVKKSVDRYHLENKVILTGKVNNVEEYLQISDVFAFPSKLEGMPNVVLESMASGVPVVSYRVSGVEDIIQQDVNGEIIDVGDRQHFKSALINLLQDTSKLNIFSLQAHSDISKRFSVEFIADRYIKLYRDL